jgi:hypothetical protein
VERSDIHQLQFTVVMGFAEELNRSCAQAKSLKLRQIKRGDRSRNTPAPEINGKELPTVQPHTTWSGKSPKPVQPCFEKYSA